MLHLVFLMSLFYTPVSLQPTRPFCGSVCDYEGGYRNADCSEKGLQQVPAADGCQSVRMMDLSYNRISSLHENDMLGYRDVEHLEMSHNAISDVEPRSFTGCNSVIYIYLSSNQIQVLQNGVFSGTEASLQQLHLDRNELTEIESGTLKNLTKLTHLFFSHNNLITLSPSAFQDLLSLQSLHLGSNRLNSLPVDLFETMCRLENLDLSNNDVTVLGDIMFNPSCHLVTFVLANNRLRNIPYPSPSSGLARVQTLDVRNNNITDASNITQYILTTEKLFIDNNPFYCDCNLENVRVWIQQEVTSKTSSELSCIMPSCGESRLIRSLPDLCPTTITPPATTTPPTTTSTSSQSTPPEEMIQKATLSKIVSATALKGNEISVENDTDEKQWVFKEGSPSYYGLIFGIMVVAISVFVILLGIIILLAICLCQTNRNVEKMTKAILDSKITPRPLKKVVNRVKNLTSPTVPVKTDNREKNVAKDETKIPNESTPKVSKVDMTGVRKRSPQSTDKMIPKSIKNDQNAIKIDDDKINEKKPFIRKLHNQFEMITSLKEPTDENIHDEAAYKHDESTPNESKIDMTGSLKRSPQPTDKMLPNNSPCKINNMKNQNAPKIGGDYGKSSDKNDEEKKPFIRSLDNQFKKMTKGREKKSDAGVVVHSITDGKGTERRNAAENDSDKENCLNHSSQTKDSENVSQNEGKIVKVALRDTPQKSGERKRGVLMESNLSNLNLTSSNC